MRAAPAAALLLGFATAAWAGDRPFVATTTASTEPDDDRVWALDSVAQRLGGQNSALINAEYSFDPQTSAQLSLAGARREQNAAVEFKRVFNSFHHDGWGVGLSLELGARRAAGGGWRGDVWQLTLPLSWQASPAWRLHANLGLQREGAGAETERQVTLAAEWAVQARWTLLAEAARSGDTTLLNAGLRWWLKRERLALDMSAQQTRGGGLRQRGWVLGLSWLDL